MTNNENNSFNGNSRDSLWYKDAIIYQLHVRAFFDGNNDGIGDFAGLTQKLDYLQDLGVTALWLLPFYPSPLRDDGYDISDYMSVHPSYGTLRDLKLFIKEANRRGLKVITELVLNHTSDQHPWFQRARISPPGSRFRDYYVWSDTPEKYKDARIIFKDFEPSNWTYDSVAKAYYWHRFYSHQPDLNFDNSDTRRAIFRVLDFYLNLGVSGLRLDAIPYLYERENTSCENLPETHSLLKQLRAHVDRKFKARMLLAEANQWPEDAAAYFGNADECHMAFHFPLMPRMFMAIRTEDRYPIVEVLQRTPQIPESVQWAIFLRNHDELTLEMVTDEERDYMYRMYAHDPQARINLGIRRRLAPLLENDRRKIELMNALLFSLPGTPVVYYGDEIGMGDNIYLGDRNGVRTPMQWTADRNAGFSKVDPQKLYLPVINSPAYHYEALNVEAQQSTPSSLLWWMKHLIEMRKRVKAFSRGTLEFLYPENSKVLTYVRKYEDEVVLVAANLSRVAEYVSLDLSRYKGKAPVDLFGHRVFPTIGESPYILTLGPRSFFWFKLETAASTAETKETVPSSLPGHITVDNWKEIFEKVNYSMLENALPEYLATKPWFGGKDRVLQSIDIHDVIPFQYERGEAKLLVVSVEYYAGEPEAYLVPIVFATADKAANVAKDSPQSILAYVDSYSEKQLQGVLFDATIDKDFQMALLNAVEGRKRFRGAGVIIPFQTNAFEEITTHDDESIAPKLPASSQTNIAISYGNKFTLKIFPRFDEGVNPDLEARNFLAEKTTFTQFPKVYGALEYQLPNRREQYTIGILQEYLVGSGDAWQYTLNYLGRHFSELLAQEKQDTPTGPQPKLLALASKDIGEQASKVFGEYIHNAQLIGQRTAEMHIALSSAANDAIFAPEALTEFTRKALYQRIMGITEQTLQMLKNQMGGFSKENEDAAAELLKREQEARSIIYKIRDSRIHGKLIRCHGDYHLGCLIYTGSDFKIGSFEGEAERPISERRLKSSPMKDIATMVRSFDYASYSALQGQAPTVLRKEDLPALEGWARLWYRTASSAFLKAYFDNIKSSHLLPDDPTELRLLTDAYLLEKAIYEVRHELRRRTNQIAIPIKGVLELLGAQQKLAA